MQEVLKWLMENKEEIGLFLLSLIATAELFVRLTPTKTDDGAVERIGALIKRILDWLKIPNVAKKDDSAK